MLTNFVKNLFLGTLVRFLGTLVRFLGTFLGTFLGSSKMPFFVRNEDGKSAYKLYSVMVPLRFAVSTIKACNPYH